MPLLDSARQRALTASRKQKQIDLIDLLATDKSRYFAQPRPIIVKYLDGRDLKKTGCGVSIQACYGIPERSRNYIHFSQ